MCAGTAERSRFQAPLAGPCTWRCARAASCIAYSIRHSDERGLYIDRADGRKSPVIELHAQACWACFPGVRSYLLDDLKQRTGRMTGASYRPNCCRTILMDVQPMYYPIGNTKAASVYQNPFGEEEMRVRPSFPSDWQWSLPSWWYLAPAAHTRCFQISSTIRRTLPLSERVRLGSDRSTSQSACQWKPSCAANMRLHHEYALLMPCQTMRVALPPNCRTL